MSRENVLQVTVSDFERTFIEGCAKANGISISACLRHRLFGGNKVLTHAIHCASLAEAYAMVADLEAREIASDAWPWSLLFLREHQGVDSVVCQVLGIDMMPIMLHVTHESRFIVAGSPWPYKLLENYSWTVPGGTVHTVLRLTNERDQNLWAPLKKTG